MKTKKIKGIKEVNEETYQEALLNDNVDGYIWLTTIYGENDEVIKENIYLGDKLYGTNKKIINCGEY